MSTGIARQLVPEAELSSTDRRVDLVREGFDCVIRVDPMAKPSLVARHLGNVRVVTCASPGYWARKGVPHTLADLTSHELVHYVSTLGTCSPRFETLAENGETHFHPMPSRITASSAEAHLGACAAGLRLIRAPLLGVRELINRGPLLKVMPEHPARADDAAVSPPVLHVTACGDGLAGGGGTGAPAQRSRDCWRQKTSKTIAACA
nr:LysR substrate-binding domain-containing protein [uncultured Acidovorax sp.]